MGVALSLTMLVCLRRVQRVDLGLIGSADGEHVAPPVEGDGVHRGCAREAHLRGAQASLSELSSRMLPSARPHDSRLGFGTVRRLELDASPELEPPPRRLEAADRRCADFFRVF